MHPVYILHIQRNVPAQLLERLLLCLLSLSVLSGCAGNQLSKQPLQSAISTDVQLEYIELAELEVDKVLLIRRLNPLLSMMGSSGMVLDALLVAEHAAAYERVAGPVKQQAMALFKQILARDLTRQGYRVHVGHQCYWDYYRGKQKAYLGRIDAILRIKLRQVGFRAAGLDSPFVPSVLVQATLIEPASRTELYYSSFAMGLDAGSLRVLGIGDRAITKLRKSENMLSFQSFGDLLAQPRLSRDALFSVLKLAARRVAKGLRRMEDIHFIVQGDLPHEPLPAGVGHSGFDARHRVSVGCLPELAEYGGCL